MFKNEVKRKFPKARTWQITEAAVLIWREHQREPPHPMYVLNSWVVSRTKSE